MQTFLPYPDMYKSLTCLDYRRLGKQRVESSQILDTLYGLSDGWQNHPAVNMWRGYENALTLYYNLSLLLWEQRGYRNVKLQPRPYLKCSFNVPIWWGDPDFHRSHQSNLKRKKPDYYLFDVPDNLPYVWPI